MTTVHDVAKYVLTAAGKPMSTMKLQKLVYYCQAWHVTLTGERLFPEDFQAWANGPVCYDLFDEHRGRYSIAARELPRGNAGAVRGKAKRIVDEVLAEYAPFSAAQLNEETHAEAPWLDARDGVPERARSANVITVESMAAYYGERAEATA